MSSVWVITSEIVEVRNRAKWSQALSITWSCSAIAGPLLGGLFSCEISHGHIIGIQLICVPPAADTNTLSWRWACKSTDRRSKSHC